MANKGQNYPTNGCGTKLLDQISVMFEYRLIDLLRSPVVRLLEIRYTKVKKYKTRWINSALINVQGYDNTATLFTPSNHNKVDT